MRRFRVKNLMIHVMPEGGERGGCQVTVGEMYRADCYRGTIIPEYDSRFCTPNCPEVVCKLPSVWDPCMILRYTGTVQPEWPKEWPPEWPPEWSNAGNLAILKDQLKQALAEVERQEKIMAEIESPQTLEEIEALEQKLKEALEEVKARKKEVQQ